MSIGGARAIEFAVVGLLILAGCSRTPERVTAAPEPDRKSTPDAGVGSFRVVAELGGDVPLRRLWGSSDRDIWLVGGNPFPIDPGFTPGVDAPQAARIVHVVHDKGVTAAEVIAPTSTMLAAIWGASERDIWAGGEHGPLLHYDGVTWTARATMAVSAIWGTSSSDVWFAADRSVVHWDGTAFSAPMVRAGPAAPGDDIALSLFGFAPNDVWLGGASGTLLHWDGAAWKSRPTGSALYVYGLFGASPTDLWGVGNGGYLLHWDGAKLTHTMRGYTSFNAIAGHGRDDVWAVGELFGDGRRVGWASHFDGTAWTPEEVPEVHELRAIWASASGAFYALGDGNRLLRAERNAR